MTERRYLYSLEEIKTRLQARALDLARHLAPGGTLVGPHWVARSPLRPSDRHPSPLINVRKGVWKDWASGEGGDMLHFVALVACRGDYKKAVPWAKDFLGLTGRAPDKAECERIEREANAARADEEKRALQRRRSAFALLCEAKPLDGEDPASLYLKARGIDVTKMAGGIPRALRFLAKCKAFPEETTHPALLAFISREDLPNGFAAVHRTYLENYLGTWRKRQFPERDGKRMAAKRVLGSYLGASIRLTRGKSGKQLKDAPAGEWITVTEGIENGLSIAVAQPHMRVLACVSLANLGGLWLPPSPPAQLLGGMYVARDNDAEGSQADQALSTAVNKLNERFAFEIAVVTMDGEYKDANEALIGKRA